MNPLMRFVTKFSMTLLIACSSLTAHPQGTVLFDNINVGAPNAPVFESDGVTKLSGPQFTAELFAGPSANSLAFIAMTGFLTGNGAGYFLGGTQTINSVIPGTIAWVQVDVWNTASGSSFGQAQNSGLANSWWQSPVFSVVTGNQFTFGGGFTPPALLSGLGTSPVFLNSVPEPSTVTLIGLGLAAVFRLVHRKSGHPGCVD